ncbi:hypothetical protein CCP1ISM_190003 [Azospirillaceae bacterium]
MTKHKITTPAGAAQDASIAAVPVTPTDDQGIAHLAAESCQIGTGAVTANSDNGDSATVLADVIDGNGAFSLDDRNDDDDDDDVAHDNPYGSAVTVHDEQAGIAGSALTPATDAELAAIHARVTDAMKSLSTHASAADRELVRSTIQAASFTGSLMEGGSVFVRQLTVAATTALFITAAPTDDRRSDVFTEEVNRLKLTASNSKSAAANAVVATLRLDIKDPNKKLAGDNRRRVDRDALAVEGTARVLLNKAKSGSLDLNDGAAILAAALDYIKPHGVVKISNDERKRKRDLQAQQLVEAGGKDITAIPLDGALYAEHRTAMVKSRFGSETDRDFSVGLGIVEASKVIDFLPISHDPKLKQRLLDTLVVPPSNVQFVSELMVLGNTIAEVKTKELVNKTDDPKDPNAPRIMTDRVLIARPDNQFVVTARHRDAGVVLLAAAIDPANREPIHGDLILTRVGHQYLAVNLLDEKRRAAFTLTVTANRNDNAAINPHVAILSTRVADTDSHRASCVATFRRADRSKVWNIRVVDLSLVKPTRTAIIKATVFQDAADRLTDLTGKKAGSCVNLCINDDGLVLSNDAGRVAVGGITEATGNALSVPVNRGDLTAVVAAIGNQTLMEPVKIGLDPTGMVRFDFATMVGRFTFLVPVWGSGAPISRHFVPFTPLPWVDPAVPAAA